MVRTFPRTWWQTEYLRKRTIKVNGPHLFLCIKGKMEKKPICLNSFFLETVTILFHICQKEMECDDLFSFLFNIKFRLCIIKAVNWSKYNNIINMMFKQSLILNYSINFSNIKVKRNIHSKICPHGGDNMLGLRHIIQKSTFLLKVLAIWESYNFKKADKF